MIDVQETLSELTLIVTCTLPGLGVMDPESRTNVPNETVCGFTLRDIDVIWRNVALTVTEPAGIANAHGLIVGPLEHEAPVVVHAEKTQPPDGEAETEIGAPKASVHPAGQFGEREPEPEATLVVKTGANAKAGLFA
jgi:hypothetical protein